MTGRAEARSAVVKWLQETPGLRNAEIAALADQPEKYVQERMRVFELSGHVVRGEPVRVNGHLCTTWKAADPQPARKVRSDKGRNKTPARAKVKKLPQYTGQVVVERPAPNRDRHIVGQALAQLPDLQAAWMGMVG